MVFNTCGKRVGFDWLLHKFPLISRCFCRYVPPFPLWMSKNEGEWKSGEAHRFSSTFFAFSTRLFHQQGHLKIPNAARVRAKASKKGIAGAKVIFLANLSTFFPHQNVAFQTQKCATYPAFRAFPQFPQALLRLLLNIYIILSLYALRAKKSERVPRKEFLL